MLHHFHLPLKQGPTMGPTPQAYHSSSTEPLVLPRYVSSSCGKMANGYSGNHRFFIFLRMIRHKSFIVTGLKTSSKIRLISGSKCELSFQSKCQKKLFGEGDEGKGQEMYFQLPQIRENPICFLSSYFVLVLHIENTLSFSFQEIIHRSIQQVTDCNFKENLNQIEIVTPCYILTDKIHFRRQIQYICMYVYVCNAYMHVNTLHTHTHIHTHSQSPSLRSKQEEKIDKQKATVTSQSI